MAQARQKYGGESMATPGYRSSGFSSGDSSRGAGKGITNNNVGSTMVNASKVGANTAVNVAKSQSNPTPSYSGGGGGEGYSAPSYSGPSSDDIINKIKSLLNEQKEQADKYYQTLYEQQIEKNRQGWEADRNQINKNYMRGRNYINQLYGDAITGPGITNQTRNNQNWQSNLASARQNYTNNDATALSQLNMNKANTASTLAQGWYNYVLPVYTNRQQNLDDYDYRKYLASL